MESRLRRRCCHRAGHPPLSWDCPVPQTPHPDSGPAHPETSPPWPWTLLTLTLRWHMMMWCDHVVGRPLRWVSENLFKNAKTLSLCAAVQVTLGNFVLQVQIWERRRFWYGSQLFKHYERRSKKVSTKRTHLVKPPTTVVIPYDLVYSARNFVPILGLWTSGVASYKRAKLHWLLQLLIWMY